MDNMKPEGFYKALLSKWKDEKYAREQFNDGNPSRYTQFDVIMDCCREAANSSRRDPIFDIECGWSVRLHSGNAYLTPYGEHTYRKGMRKPEYAEDFAYWNNTDAPDGMSPGRWDRRAKVWDKLFEVPALVYAIVDLKQDPVNTMVKIQQSMKVGLFADIKNGLSET